VAGCLFVVASPIVVAFAATHLCHCLSYFLLSILARAFALVLPVPSAAAGMRHGRRPAQTHNNGEN
jgi:hypothetical protein